MTGLVRGETPAVSSFGDRELRATRRIFARDRDTLWSTMVRLAESEFVRLSRNW